MAKLRAWISIGGLAAPLWMAVPSGAHGVIEDPPSRMWICGEETKPDQIALKTAKTPACSTAFAINHDAAYNFMAVVNHSLGRSHDTPLPAYVCGYAGEFWKGAETPWDVALDWPAAPMSAGPKTITWNIVWGPHFDDTHDFKYWITKADFVFSPTKPLAWDDFETEPFCSLTYDDTKPDANPAVTADKPGNRFVTRCTLPVRTGHHVVYGEWGRTEPTLERFHGCFDGQFAGTSIRVPLRPGAVGLTDPGFDAMGVDLLGRPRDRGRPGILPRLPAVP